MDVTFVAADCNARILYPVAPDGGVQAASNELDSRFLKPITHLPPAKALIISQPFGVYYYGVNYTNLFSGELLSATRLCSWRFLLTDGTNSAGLDLGYDEKKGKWPEIGWCFYLARQKSDDPVLETLQAAERLPQVKKEDYELRYLDFLDIQFFAVWLHGKSNDIIIPVPIYGRWQDFRPYSEGEIAAILRREIQGRMKQHAHPGPGILVD